MGIRIAVPQWPPMDNHFSKDPRSISIRHRSDREVSDRCLIDIVPRVFGIWDAHFYHAHRNLLVIESSQLVEWNASIIVCMICTLQLMAWCQLATSLSSNYCLLMLTFIIMMSGCETCSFCVPIFCYQKLLVVKCFIICYIQYCTLEISIIIQL